MALTLMKQASLPMQYWSDAFFTVVFLINRLPSKVLINASPHEKFFLKPPDCDFLWVFGCMYFPLLRPYNKHKLDFRYASCVFLGYYSNQHGYKRLDMSNRVYVSRHVKFHESVFPFVDKQGSFMQSSTSKNMATSSPFFQPFNYVMCSQYDDIPMYPSVFIDRQPDVSLRS